MAGGWNKTSINYNDINICGKETSYLKNDITNILLPDSILYGHGYTSEAIQCITNKNNIKIKNCLVQLSNNNNSNCNCISSAIRSTFSNGLISEQYGIPVDGAKIIFTNEMNSTVTYNTVKIYNKKFILYIKLYKIKDLISRYNYSSYYKFIYDIDTTSKNNRLKIENEYSKSEILNIIPDDSYIADMYFYDNSIDNISSTNQRKILNTYNFNFFSIINFTQYSYQNYDQTTEDVYKSDIYNNGMMISNYPNCLINQNSLSGINTLISTIALKNEIEYVVPQEYYNDSNFIVEASNNSGITGYVRNLGSGSGSILMHGFTKNKLTEILNSFGIAWTYSEDSAKNLPINNPDFNPDYTPQGQPEDPTGGNTQGGGTGTGDNSSDKNSLTTPAFSSIGAFSRCYALTSHNISDLRDYLWNKDLFNVENFMKLFGDPMQAVISLRMFPFDLSNHDSAHISADTSIKLGNFLLTAQGAPIDTNYNQVFDLGTFSIDEYYGTAMDYSPYTKIMIYLPYIGIRQLNNNDYMGKTLNVKYIVDIMTGACVATIWRDEQLINHYDGKIGQDIPLSSNNNSQFAVGIAQGVTNAALGVAGAATGQPIVAGMGILSAAKSVTGSQMTVQSGGVASPNSSFWMPQYCYIIITRPYQSLSSKFYEENGAPSNVAATLSSVSGMTVIDNVILDGFTCTDEEKNEIKSLMKEGIIL